MIKPRPRKFEKASKTVDLSSCSRAKLLNNTCLFILAWDFKQRTNISLSLENSKINVKFETGPNFPFLVQSLAYFLSNAFLISYMLYRNHIAKKTVTWLLLAENVTYYLILSNQNSSYQHKGIYTSSKYVL